MNRKKKKLCIPKGERMEWQYKCIDGNWSYYPVAYCKYYDGVLTEGLIHTHRCREKECNRLDETQEFE